ncbi:hypothetical protein MO973_38400 [Paenibacillus sp. TRM 82003]|uniref:hypothetical protein n=1 Tax=Kineococcus sp. TRM81007 TaxID=2925831 RepID=UPI001F58FDA4|nr:hypothetical protein [Kineococcus sp. TRM81007]MCI2238062.1 hypothetical protein [Kineococcus sp. TRM81007]MCI3926076.1 hypothetical protein [Paenibacillus sp. TRM 82003]
MSTTAPELPAHRRAAAIRAFRALPAADRRDVLALARQGRRHPDERVVAVAWWYAASVLQPRWWNRVPAGLLLLPGLVVLCAAFAVDAWPLAVLAVLLIGAGLNLVWQRLTTEPLLRLARPADAADDPAGTPEAPAAGR